MDSHTQFVDEFLQFSNLEINNNNSNIKLLSSQLFTKPIWRRHSNKQTQLFITANLSVMSRGIVLQTERNQYYIDSFAKKKRWNKKARLGEQKTIKYEKIINRAPRGDYKGKTINNNNFCRASGRPRFAGEWKVCSINYFVAFFDIFLYLARVAWKEGKDFRAFVLMPFTSFPTPPVLSPTSTPLSLKGNKTVIITKPKKIISKLMKEIMETRELSVTRQMNFRVRDWNWFLFYTFLDSFLSAEY